MELLRYDRAYQLEDIIVRSGFNGKSKIVEAYASVFGIPQQIRDQHGHYIEVIHRNAFDDELAEGFDNVSVYYNHGFDLHGSPSGIGAVPIGSPTDITADRRGLLTVSRYNDGPLADLVLAAIRNNDIKAYSFRGPIRRSDPPGRIQRTGLGGGLPRVTRMALGLTEYGPTPTAAYKDAAILAVR